MHRRALQLLSTLLLAWTPFAAESAPADAPLPPGVSTALTGASTALTGVSNALTGASTALTGVSTAAAGVSIAPTGVSTPPADVHGATLVLAARSIGSRRGDPPERRAHAALLVTFPARPGGVIVQGGKEKVPGLFRDRDRVVGYVIPSADPAAEFTRAYGAYWGEPTIRELPTTVLARFTVPGLTEERIRAIVAALNDDLASRAYRLEAGPSSNSFVSRFLDALDIPLPAIGDAQLPGWGWRP